MKRQILAVGNWKMHKTGRQAAQFVRELAALLTEKKVGVWLAPAFPAIPFAVEAAGNSAITIGAQNMHEKTEGAFTGEVSADMLKEAGAQFVILGHSERRLMFYETNELIAQKLQQASAVGLIPILCVGESLDERKSGKTKKILQMQLNTCLSKHPLDSPIVIAYEPVWAIGSGTAATSEMAQEAHSICRDAIEALWGSEIAHKISILYGGSVRAEIATSLIQQKDIDGVLVGGASLEVDHFFKIIQRLSL